MKKESKGLRITANIVRILLGLVFFAGGLSYFFMPSESLDPATKGGAFMVALLGTGYFLPFLKIVETVCGFMLFWKRWTPLSLIVLSPIVVNIFLYFVFLDSSSILFGLVLGAMTVFLGWYNWDKFKQLFEA